MVRCSEGRTGLGEGDVGIDAEIVVAVQLTVEIQVAVVEAEDDAGVENVGVDVEVVVAVELTIEIGVAAPGLFDENVGGGDGNAGEVSARIAGVVGAGHGECREQATGRVGHGSDDSAAVP